MRYDRLVSRVIPALPLGEVETGLDRALQRMSKATEDFELADNEAAGQRTEFTGRELVVMRVREHGEDIVSFMPLVRELEVRAKAGEREAMGMLRARRLETPAHWRERVNLGRPTRSLAASMKAILFFVRAFTDAVYAAALVLGGQPVSTKTTSMNDALTAWKKSPTVNSRHHLPHLAFERHAPGFYEWFEAMRRDRNDFKSADARVGAEWHCPDPAEETSSLHVTVSRRGREGGTGVLTLADVEEAVVWCTKLAEVLELEAQRQVVRRGGKTLERSCNESPGERVPQSDTRLGQIVAATATRSR